MHCLTLLTRSLLIRQEATGQLTHQSYSCGQKRVQRQFKEKKLCQTSTIVVFGHNVLDFSHHLCKASSTSVSIFPGSPGKRTQKLTNSSQEWQIWKSHLPRMELRLLLRLQMKGSSRRAMQWYPCCSLSAIQICLVLICGSSPVSFCRPATTMMKVMMLILVVIQTMSHPTMVQIKRRKPSVSAF